MQILSIDSFPWQSQSLIEASAGTGKTYTIAGLYNRLILGHQHSPLNCDQILVVTFTNAATEELRGRLRARIQRTMQLLLQCENIQSSAPSAEQMQLQTYVQGMSAAQRETLLVRLRHNLALMDEASIFTIHSFCQRILKRFAFDTGVMFSSEVSLDVQRYLQQACEDVWRQEVYKLNPRMAELVFEFYRSPNDLLRKVQPRLSKKNLHIEPKFSVSTVAQAWQQYEEAFLRVRQVLAASSVEELADRVKQSGLNPRSYTDKFTKEHLGGCWDFFQAEPNYKITASVEKFDPDFMETKLKESGVLPEHEFFTQIAAFFKARESTASFLNLGWLNAIQERFFTLLDRDSTLTGEDMMRLLNEALSSTKGEELAQQIRALYPVAMIDEFQDTDALQYSIFTKLYPFCESAASHSLIMIGDPKQAIYAFRGADVFTYMQAKAAIPAQAQFTLKTNFRSHSELISGVNALFQQKQNPFLYQEIEFVPVDSSGAKDDQAFNLGTDRLIPLQFFCHAEALNNESSQEIASEQCAQQIADLLTGQVRLGKKWITAQDIAVLVKDRHQAARIRADLHFLGVNSVFLSKDSVFSSAEAQDLYLWLQAISQPTNERHLRAALASALQGFSAHYLATLLVDETQWEEALAQNAQYHQLWQRRGIMAAIMAWLEQDDLAQRIREQYDGERKLTNLLHLADLLQTMSHKLHSQDALLRWYGESVFSQEQTNDDTQLRLESDASLVSIVTIHSSKGLQYPLVFLPFIWRDQTEPRNGEDCVYFDENNKELVLHLAPSEAQKAAAQKAKDAEAMRLLYVALTRAEQGCFVWLMNNTSRNKSEAQKSALGKLLALQTEDGALNLTELEQRMRSLPFYFGELPNWQTPPRAQPSAPVENIVARTTFARTQEAWRVTSYSALATHSASGTAPELPQTMKQDEGALWVGAAQDEHNLSQENTAPEVQFDAQTLALNFTKGAQAGSALHDVLEHWDFHHEQMLADLCTQKLAYYGLGIEESQKAALHAWFRAMVNTPLLTENAGCFCLADVGVAQRLAEMEFHLPVQNLLSASQIETLLGGKARFDFQPLTGFLKGFIDLIFVHQGRYYVADYKSNFLGLRAQDYLGENLEKAMQEHAYDFQAWIYTLALDALLRWRLGSAYQPKQHLGGVYYLFLRAMHVEASRLTAFSESGKQAPGVYYLKPDLEKLQQWRQAFFTQEASSVL